MEFVASTPGNVFGQVGAVSLGTAAATPVGRTVLMVVNNDAGISAVIKEFGVFFDGISATNAPVLVELVEATMANPGFAGQPATIRQWRGQGNAPGAGLTSKFTAFAGYSLEPTVISRLEPYLVPPTTGLVVPFALGDEPEIIAGVGSMGIGLRVLNLQAVNVQAYIRFAQANT